MTISDDDIKAIHDKIGPKLARNVLEMRESLDYLTAEGPVEGLIEEMDNHFPPPDIWPWDEEWLDWDAERD
jgi:hypothetical protein